MNIGYRGIAISIFIIIFGAIGFAKLTGLWKTTTEKIPTTIQEGTYAGLPKPNEIKGSYTFEDVAKNFNIPKEDLAEAFKVDINKFKTFKCKDIKTNFENSKVEIGVASIRAFVAFCKGMEIDLTEDVYLPKSVANVINP